MSSCMCKFVFVKDKSNSVLLLTLMFFQMCSSKAAPRCICSFGRTGYISSRGTARVFYLNKVLPYIIYLCFRQFYFQ